MREYGRDWIGDEVEIAEMQHGAFRYEIVAAPEFPSSVGRWLICGAVAVEPGKPVVVHDVRETSDEDWFPSYLDLDIDGADTIGVVAWIGRPRVPEPAP